MTNRWNDPNVAVGICTYAANDDSDDTEDFHSAFEVQLDMNWPLPPQDKSTSLISDPSIMASDLIAWCPTPEPIKEEDRDWPLPSKQTSRTRTDSAVSVQSRVVRPHRAASVRTLDSTRNWSLPVPTPRVSIEKYGQARTRVTPPPSPVWPLPPNVERFVEVPPAAVNDEPKVTTVLCEKPYTYHDSEDSGSDTETLHSEQPPIHARKCDACAISSDDWLAQFDEDDDTSETATDECPDRATLAAVEHIQVLDRDGAARSFGSLYEPEHAPHPRQLIVFIRHFYCGGCQAYIKRLAESTSTRAYQKIKKPTRIIVIGCGQPSMIDYYRALTQCPFPIYVEPSRKLFRKLGMHVSANMGVRTPEYMKGTGTISWLTSQVRNIHEGLWRDKENPLMLRDVFRGGNILQIGGEFLFEDGQVVWCHRMRNYRNHAELPILRKLLDLED